MTISTNLVTLGTAAQQVVGPSTEPQFVTMHNMTKSSNEYIFYGNATVGTGNAPHIDPGDTLQLRLLPGEALYAVSEPSGLDLGVFIQKQDN
jgi:hypothetical protein